NLGVIFIGTPGFTSELHTLIVDASDANLGSDGRPLLNVVGVRADWLGPGNTARRAILEDGQGGLVETDLSPSLPLDAVLFLCLGEAERGSAREVTGRFATEGAGVTAVEWTPSRRAEAVEKLATLRAEYGDVVVRPLVGNVRFGSPSVSADLRVNVAWNGTEFVAESGFLQVASDAAEI